MDNSSSALKPEFFNSLPSILADQQTGSAEVGEEERQLYVMSNTAGWKILREYSQGLLNDLDEVTNLALTQGLSLEEIGKNAVVANLAKGIIKRILDKVVDAREAIEHPDGTLK